MKFVIILGPPAVGKMAVGIKLAELTGMKLFHNHMTIELILNFFEFGTKEFGILVNEFRRRIFEVIASSRLIGLIFTYVTAMNLENEKRYLSEITDIFRKYNAQVYYVELKADLAERIRRNKSPLRIKEKPSKRNVVQSEKWLLEDEKKYIMNSTEEFPFFFKDNYIKIDNTKKTAEGVAIQIRNHFKL